MIIKIWYQDEFGKVKNTLAHYEDVPYQCSILEDSGCKILNTVEYLDNE